LGVTLGKKLYSAKYQAFLERLRQARKDKGMTQVEVASSLGKHQSYVAKCENGERRVDIIELAQFAKLYKKPLDYFLS
jgi:transcriptional regulator with XRE-family HTH domain